MDINAYLLFQAIEYIPCSSKWMKAAVNLKKKNLFSCVMFIYLFRDLKCLSWAFFFELKSCDTTSSDLTQWLDLVSWKTR